MKRRLPLILVGVLGIWLWQGGGGLVSVEHTLVWKVPAPSATVRKVEAQLWEGEALVVRFEVMTPTGALLDPERRLTLARGTYRSALLVWREGVEAPQVHRSAVEVGAEPVVVIR